MMHTNKLLRCAHILLVVTLLLAPIAARAGLQSVLAKGFEPNVAYEVHEFDTVNTFSGSLLMHVPLGPTYRTNGTLSYAFQLNYQTNFWFFREFNGINQANNYIAILGYGLNSYGHAYYGLQIYSLDAPHDTYLGSEAVPSGTAGIGWQLNVDQFFSQPNFSAPYDKTGTYVDPSGTAHDFKTALHSTSPNYDGAAYTQDGTYLRLRVVSNDPAQPIREIDFPDGTVKRFVCVDRCNDSHQFGAQWVLKWVADPFGNVLKFDRSPSEKRPAAGTPWIWTITEASVHNDPTPESPYYDGLDALDVIRTHTLTFAMDRSDARYPWIGERLTEARLSGPNGDPMTYTLEYDQDAHILRAPVYPMKTASELLIPFIGDQIAVPLLRSVTLPASGGKWQFDYYDGLENYSQQVIDSLAYTFVPSHRTSKLAGLMKSATAPTAGGYRYEYTSRGYPKGGCIGRLRTDGGYGGGVAVGIKTRQQIRENGTEVAGAVWRYSGHGYFRRFVDNNNDGNDDGFTCRSPTKFIAATLDPNGLLTLNYYNVIYSDPNSPWYGAPFSPDLIDDDRITRRDGTTVVRHLTSQSRTVDLAAQPVFATDLANAVRRLFRENRFDDEVATVAPVLRSQYAIYTASAFDCATETTCQQINMRLASAHERFHDDSRTTNFTPPNLPSVTERPFVETVRNDFDLLGHFRQTNTYGNLKAVSKNNSTADDWDHRVEYVSFNKDRGIPAASERWILNTYAHKTIWEKNVLSTTRALFDSRGFLLATRTMKSNTAPGSPSFDPDATKNVLATEGGDDLLTTFERANGVGADGGPAVILTEKSYGGDGAGLGTWPNTPLTASYEIESTSQYGSLAQTRYVGCGGTVEKPYSAVIEPGMGLAESMSDESGLSTQYDYDALGRVSSVTPPGGQTPQSYHYEVRTAPGNTANRIVVERTNGPRLTYEYDHLGRMSAESQQMPSAMSTTGHIYTLTGQLFQTILPFESPSHVIQYTYDALGRQTLVKNADNKTSDTLFFGARELTTTTHQVAVDVGNNNAQLTKKFDSFGRLSEVSDGLLHAEYEYDVLSNLTKARLNPVGSSTPVQERTFTYDGRGFLTEAEHPELKSSTNGPVLVRNKYDARGHVTQTEYAWKTGAGNKPPLDQWRLTFELDKAERLRKVKQPSAGAQAARDYKEFNYFPNDDPVGRRNRLKSSIRHNYVSETTVANGATLVTMQTIDVKTDYAYTCPNTATCTGLLQSETTLAFNSGQNGQPQTVFSGVVGYEYNVLGELRRIAYPQGNVGHPRYVHHTYSYGFLTDVRDGDANGTSTVRRAGMTYSVNGMVKQVDYSAAGVSDVIEPDLYGLSRPRSITWKWNGRTESSGPYLYDGAGNIESIDTDTFRYDKALRLKSGSVGGQSETYAYDAFGNLTRAGTRQYIADPASNRLTSRSVGSSSRAIDYDDSGNVIRMPDARSFSYPVVDPRLNFSYDPFNVMIEMTGENLGRSFVYDASDERIAVIDYRAAGGRRELWSLRDQSDRVLRDFERTFSPSGMPLWSWKKDYVYRGSILANTIRPNASTGVDEVRDVHVDHLGSVRFITDAAGNLVLAPGASTSGQRYFPFGALVSPRQFNDLYDDRLAFTGHERDDDGTGSDDADVDYMHARFYMPSAGRFLSLDPGGMDPEHPQSWNRYAYARNNPVRIVDPDGADGRDVVGGYINALGSDILLGAGREQPVNDDYANGQGLGDLTATLLGMLEADAGASALAGAVVCEAGTVGGCTPAAVPAGVVGAVAMVHGSAMSATGLRNLISYLVASGPFSIIDWKGYPDGAARPGGPVEMKHGEEYKGNRKTANNANRKTHRDDPTLKGKEIHEIQPVKFGGDPKDPANKVALSREEHSKLTTWWNRLKRDIERRGQ